MKNKVYVITFVEYNDTTDRKARTLGIYKTYDKAKKYLHEDMMYWANERSSEGIEINYDKMCAWYDYNTNDRCEWNIEECQEPID